MPIVYFGESTSTVCVVVLSFLVIVNFYDLLVSSLNDENHTNRLLSSDDFEMEKLLILLQTILSIFAISLHKQYTSFAMNLIKIWISGLLMVTLFFDMTYAATTAVYLLFQRLDKSEEKSNANKEVEPTPLPDVSCMIFFAEAVLFLYLVFKLYAFIIMFHYVGTFAHKIGILDSYTNGESYLINENDIERNTSELPAPPPKYEQCVVQDQSVQPPPYNMVCKY
ncbi:uncharacterized protein LOC135837403 isoform X1 [Planococcus citri]|uniref:uncharacterized protein LOC135837403 isoform X1 n=1 Tax=Planococcus citri TaxID=170843 RepID=UPI0031F7562E